MVSIPLKNTSQLGWLFPIYGKIKHIWNQPEGIQISRCNFHLLDQTLDTYWSRLTGVRNHSSCSSQMDHSDSHYDTTWLSYYLSILHLMFMMASINKTCWISPSSSPHINHVNHVNHVNYPPRGCHWTRRYRSSLLLFLRFLGKMVKNVDRSMVGGWNSLKPTPLKRILESLGMMSFSIWKIVNSCVPNQPGSHGHWTCVVDLPMKHGAGVSVTPGSFRSREFN